MVNFARALGDKVALVVHVDKTEAAHAFKPEFEKYQTLTDKYVLGLSGLEEEPATLCIP